MDSAPRKHRNARGICGLLSSLGITAVAVALAFSSPSQPSEAAPQGEWHALAAFGPAELADADLQNVVPGDAGLVLGSDGTFEDGGPSSPRYFGVATSPVIDAETAISAVRLTFEGVTPPGTAIEAAVRVRSAGGRWSEWQQMDGSSQAFSAPAGGVAAQFMVTLATSDPGVSPALQRVVLESQPADRDAEPQYQALAGNPTVRVYGTREGLVGGRTANGHIIVDRDRFVALPSKKALSPKDKTDYQVEISYKGKKATAPVWDVGPWNSKDDYWNAPRELFNDLPRFTPQVNAAFFNNHNNGNDQYGRPVIYPAAIDIADGTFWDDLGMKSSDWVDVTFLWLDAAAPPLVPMAPIVPKAGPIPQPIFKQTQASPAPTPAPTPAPKTWFFAEGSTNKPFDTWLLLQNPAPDPVNVKVTYMLPKGGQQIGNYLLKPTSRTSLFLNSIVPNSDVSAMIESDRDILAERAMYFGSDGHVTTGAERASTTWYFAEGSTRPGFDTWLLLQNPNLVPATATITFFKEDGTTVTHKMLIPHVSRESLMVNLVVPDAAMGARIEADKPIIAERAVYKDKKAGADSVGATALSKTWYLAEGNTRADFDTWILMMNPNDTAATTTVTYLVEEGAPVVKKYTVPARARLSVSVDQELPGARVGARIESNLPIVAERTVYFAAGAASHNSMAAPALSKLWYLPEGSTAKPFWQNVLVANPGDAPANITVTFMKEDGSNVEKRYTVKPNSRFTIEVNGLVPDTALSTKVTSDQPIVVERSMYFNDFTGGHNSMGIPK